MARKKTVADPEPVEPATIPGYVYGRGEKLADIPVDALVYDPIMAPGVEGAFTLMKYHGSRDYVPYVFPRLDGTFALMAVTVA